MIGTHAHVLQGAGWRPDGVYVAYGLSNYLWWRSFGNDQDDNGVLTLTVRGDRVVDARFAPSHLDDTGVPVPATGAQAERINAAVGAGQGVHGSGRDTAAVSPRCVPTTTATEQQPPSNSHRATATDDNRGRG